MEIEKEVRHKKQKLTIKYVLDDNNTCLQKQCVNCLKLVDICNYSNNKGFPFGKHNQCNACVRELAMAYRRSRGVPTKKPTVVFDSDTVKRVCTRCELLKPINEFDKNHKGYLGHDSDCSECKKQRGEKYRRSIGIKKPKQVPTLYDDKGVATHRECTMCKTMKELAQFNKHGGGTAYLDRHPYCKDCSSERHLKQKYGLTAKDKEKMFERQNKSCDICLTTMELKTIHVDHCHKTGKIRGLLCSACNKSIGLLKDDPERCLRMAKYLKNAVADKHSK